MANIIRFGGGANGTQVKEMKHTLYMACRNDITHKLTGKGVLLYGYIQGSNSSYVYIFNLLTGTAICNSAYINSNEYDPYIDESNVLHFYANPANRPYYVVIETV